MNWSYREHKSEVVRAWGLSLVLREKLGKRKSERTENPSAAPAGRRAALQTAQPGMDGW